MSDPTLMLAEKPLHAHLATDYTNVWQLINDMIAQRFSGYVKLEFWQYEGFLIFDTGNIIQSVERMDNRQAIGTEALTGVYKKFSEPDGTISVFRIDGELIPFLLGRFQHAQLRDEKNLRQDKLTALLSEMFPGVDLGFVDIVYGEDQGWASLYLMGGQLVASALRNRAGKKLFEKQDKTLYGKILQLLDTVDNHVAMYACNALKFYEDNMDFGQIYRLLEVSENFLVLKDRILNILEPATNKQDFEKLFAELWQISCREIGVSDVTYHDEHFRGLENISIDSFNELVNHVLQQLKPVVEERTKGQGAFELVVHGFFIQYADHMRELNLVTN